MGIVLLRPPKWKQSAIFMFSIFYSVVKRAVLGMPLRSFIPLTHWTSWKQDKICMNWLNSIQNFFKNYKSNWKQKENFLYIYITFLSNFKFPWFLSRLRLYIKQPIVSRQVNLCNTGLIFKGNDRNASIESSFLRKLVHLKNAQAMVYNSECPGSALILL